MYTAPPHPGTITTGAPLAGPLSATRTRIPDGSVMNRCVMSALPAGKISSGDSGRGIDPLHDLDRASRQTCDQTEPERHVGPALVARELLLERIHRPEKRIRALHRRHALGRM